MIPAIIQIHICLLNKIVVTKSDIEKSTYWINERTGITKGTGPATSHGADVWVKIR